MKNKLYGNNIEKACKYCSYSKGKIVSDKVSCIIKGEVSSDFKCRKFDYDPMLRVPNKKAVIDVMSEDDFKL